MAAKKKVSDSKSGSKARDLARLVDQVGREVHGLGYASDLHPVQWAALRFLSDADPESRTVSGVAGFQGTTVGTASRTVSALQRKGLIKAEVDAADRRSRRLDTTAAGRRALNADPIGQLEKVLEKLSGADRKVLGDVLAKVQAALAGARA